MHSNFVKRLLKAAWVLELVVAVLILAVTLLELFLLGEGTLSQVLGGSFSADAFFADAMTIVVGIEFVKMLMLHTPRAVTDVLLFAIARQLVVNHSSAVDTLLGVAALALIFLCQHPLLVGGAQIVQAVCAAAMAPTISGLTLGLAGQSHLPAQLGRNEAWNHAGNGLSAMLGGAIGYWYGVPGVFVVMSGMLLLSLYALHGIAPRDIDHAQARGLAPEAEHATPAQRAALWHGPAALPVLCVGLVMLFFHLGNAHMLPLLGQSAVARFAINGAAYTAATVVIAQGTMILVALWAARLARRRGYGILLWCALLALPLRGCIAGFWHSPWSIIPVQMLDGVGAGILGVVTPGLAARLLNGTGHVNLGLGVIMTLQGIGASCSASYGGLVAHLLGYGPAFLALAAAPCVALGILLAGVRRLPRLHHALQPLEDG